MGLIKARSLPVVWAKRKPRLDTGDNNTLSYFVNIVKDGA